jgi:hypothetical protein
MLFGHNSIFAVTKILLHIVSLPLRRAELDILTRLFLILRRLIAGVDATASTVCYVKLLKAMFLLAFYALLRVGEITTTGTTEASRHLILRGNISITKSRRNTVLCITMNSYKHSKGAPITLRLSPQLDPLCPVSTLREFLQIRHSNSGPLLIFPDGQPVSRSFFVMHLNMALKWAKLDPRFYKTHSFRIGAATTAATLGMSDAQIQSMGRWKSQAYKKYIRIPTLPGI